MHAGMEDPSTLLGILYTSTRKEQQHQLRFVEGTSQSLLTKKLQVV
jgi:hypothetical protein